MPTYNSGSFAIEAVRSIQEQTYSNWELLISDDCSTDNTVSLLKQVAAHDPRIKFFQLPVNSGAAVVRNNSIKYATGEYLAFCDSDDRWLPFKLEKQIAFMEAGADFSFTAYELIDKTGRRLNCTVDLGQRDFVFSYSDMLRKKATLGCSTVILNRRSFTDFMMPLLRTGQDYALWLKLLKTGANAHLLPEVLVQYRINPNSISRNKIRKAKRQWQIYREIEGLPLFTSLICFLYYAWRAVFRK